MSDEGVLPEFAVVMRGYDRLQVDDYIVKQAVWLDEARSRMEVAEKDLAQSSDRAADLQEQLARSEEREFTSTPHSFEELGERVGRVLQVAWDSAEEVRRDAEKKAAELVASAEEKLASASDEVERRARQAEQEAEANIAKKREQLAGEAEALVEEARRESDDILARARGNAEHMVAEAARQRDQLRAEVATLAEQRHAAMAELARLRSGLEGLFSNLAAKEEAGGEESIDLRDDDGKDPVEAGNGPGEGPGAVITPPGRRVV